MALAEATGAAPPYLLTPSTQALFQLIGAERSPGTDRPPRPNRLRGGLSAAAPTSRGSAWRRRLRTRPGRWAGRITIDSATLVNKGFRGNRGAPPLWRPLHDRIEVVVDHPPVDRPLADRPQRRRDPGAPRPPRHARAGISYALHYPERADVDGAAPRSGDAVDQLSFEAPGPGDLRLSAAGAGRRQGGGPRSVRAQRRR